MMVFCRTRCKRFAAKVTFKRTFKGVKPANVVRQMMFSAEAVMTALKSASKRFNATVNTRVSC